MAMAPCGADACAYRNGCFSNGAMRSNAGVCQECSAGKWVSAGGCRDGAGMMGEKPCDHEHSPYREHHEHHRRGARRPAS